jgi:hypothetical protein
MGGIGVFGTVGQVQEVMVQAGQLALIEGLQISDQFPFDVVFVVQDDQPEEGHKHQDRKAVKQETLVLDAQNQEPDRGHQGQQPGQGKVIDQTALPFAGLNKFLDSFVVCVSELVPGHENMGFPKPTQCSLRKQLLSIRALRKLTGFWQLNFLLCRIFFDLKSDV